MADAMVGASTAGVGVENGNYWTESAKTLLAPLLHAAALGGMTISDVRRWTARMDVAIAGRLLEREGAESAADDLDAIASRTEERERSSVFATARSVLTAYGADAATQRSQVQNFDADKFVRSRDTVYITAPSHLQAVLAPLVAGLLEEIRVATYRHVRSPDYVRGDRQPVLWALDEVANIAPLKNLPGIVSEGGGQGLHIVACLQDLSQGRVRWGPAADGFLSLFGTKVIFPGIGDKATLDALSLMGGDWDRPYTTYNSNTGRSSTYGATPSRDTHGHNQGQGWSHSTQREARLSAADVANIPMDHALLIFPAARKTVPERWRLLRLVPYYRNPWDVALAKVETSIEYHGEPDTLYFENPSEP